MKTDKIFYTPTIQPNDTIFTLNEEESSHAIKVLRMKTNDEVTLIDGIGGVYEGTIVNPHHKRCEIEIKQYTKEFEKREFYLHIAIAPTKMNERMEWFLEKCTEIGIDEITPILCHHSERKELKIERMNKIIISAMKQSKKAYLPRLNEMTPIKTLVENATEEELYIAHCHQGEKIKLTQASSKKSILIMIGPEGDFSHEEILLANQNGFKSCTLGKSRLRTETAGIVACHTTNLINDSIFSERNTINNLHFTK